MTKIRKTCLWILLFSSFVLPVRAQWSSVASGTSQNLRGVYLLDSGVAYAVGDAGTILKSTDSGATWSALTSGTTQNLYDLHFFNDAEGVVVGDAGVIRRTTDGGATWQTIPSGVRDVLRAVSFSGANGIVGGGSLDILYSADSGASWTVAQKNSFATGFFGAHMLSPTVGFLTGQNAIFQGIFGSTVDGGAHWTFHTFYFNNSEGSADDVHFFNETTGITSGVVFDGTGAIARTTNTGSTWNSTIFSHGLQGIDFPQPETGFTVGFLGTILKSTDEGTTWSAQSSGVGIDLYDVHFATDALTGLAVGQSGVILRTTDGGEEGGLELISAVSRKGAFDVELPLTGDPGIECRSGGPRSHHKVIFTFNNVLTAVDGGAISCGSIHRIQIDEEDPHQVQVSFAAADCNAEFVTLTLTGLHDDQGHTLDEVAVTLGLLLGDVNGDGVVDRSDAEEVRHDHGARTDETNFREDIDTNGRIQAVDFAVVQSEIGSMLPP